MSVRGDIKNLHRNSVSQMENFPEERLRYYRKGSLSLLGSNQDSLLNILDNKQSICHTNELSNTMPAEHIPRHQISVKHPQISSTVQTKPNMVTPPPVPMRTPPAVPKRNFPVSVPSQTNGTSQPHQNNMTALLQNQKQPEKPLSTKLKNQQQQQQQIARQLQRRASLNNEAREEKEWTDIMRKSENQSSVHIIQNYPTILPPVSQKMRQAVRKQISNDTSKQLQNSAVLKSDNHKNQNGTVIKIPSNLNQQNSKQLPVASLNSTENGGKQHTISADRVIDTTECTILYNPTASVQKKSKASDLSFNCANVIPRRKILPPPPTDPPPSVPQRKPIGETVVENGSDLNHGPVKTGTKSEKPPPLMQVNTTSIQKSPSSNKVSIRQDSSISSDSFSQTSSPSYTTKTMETPLLPHSRFCNGKIGGYKQNSSMLVKNKAEAFDMDKDGKNNSAVLTKSISTPASLQTIVRFHNGSNMSLHHRIIRDMRRPSSSHYITGLRLRFRLAQVVVNALALLAIGGGLAAYFKAYPTPVQIQVSSNNVTSMPVVAPMSMGINPAPGVCLPVIVNFCQNHKVPYNFTIFPNYVGNFGQRDAQQELEVYDAVVDVRCYELAALFLCSVFVPKCGPGGQVVRPCRSLCSETKRRCGFFLDVFGLTLPEYIECNIFPESPDPDMCVGHYEVKAAQQRAQKPVCPNGFQCDVKRCIPKEWQCDGHVDCQDQSDELNCVQCEKGMIHCGSERCMAQDHMCDGIVDCPFAQDERNCLRLSEKNGDEGRGQLEIFKPDLQKWIPACVYERTSPNDICSLLGYANANTSHQNPSANASPPVRNQYPHKGRLHPNKKNSQKNLLQELKKCRGKGPTVQLTCTDFVCGKIRKPYAEKASLRIIGGTTSKPGDWPFLAALLGGPEEVFYCAGVLIADQWVLTASHCVGNHSDVTGWTIQLGVTRRHSHSYYGQKVKVRRVVPHPMYNIGVPHDNDVALFQLESPVTFHEHLLPVCLPPPDKELLPGTVCTVIGWGKKEDRELSEYEPAVNEVEVPVLNRDLCNNWLENRELNVTDGMICAGYKEGGKDACQGDSGGPLLCRFDSDVDRWFVGGIVSWGIKCAHPHLPGVYAYVPKYIPWIKQQMEFYSKLDASYNK